jgi:DNA ligase-1
MELKTLYHKGKAGAIYQWRTWTEGAEKFTEYGQVGGQLTVAHETCTGKNIGRANETTPEKQAELEAYSEWQHKLDRKYHQSVEECEHRKIDVMKAPTDPWSVTKKYAQYPADVQPKLDGCRCLAYWDGDRVVLQSRGRKEWNLPHIVAELEKCLPLDGMWDGELYLHGKPFQTIQSWITKQQPSSKLIEFHVFDVPIAEGEEKKWEERRKDLERLVPGTWGKADPATPHIVKVITLEVENEEQVMAFQVTCLELGFEGCMLRNRRGMYNWGHRSCDLLKVKTFEDGEFKCIGYTDGDGKNVGVVTWICSLDANAPCIGYVPGYKPKDGDGTFKADPLGKYEERIKLFQDGDKYVGRKLTVKYQEFYESGIPRFPKGKAFRDAKDLGL